jgi:hypothetical protein
MESFMSAIDPIESAAKSKLDDAELVELRPALQRKATAVNYDESGGLVLVLPCDPDVNAFIRELDEIQYETADLKAARRRLRVARDQYQTRVANRVALNLESPKFNRFVSLSAILIARAAGKHWHKVVRELEYFERVKKHNERAAAQRRDNDNAFCLIGDRLYPKDNAS